MSDETSPVDRSALHASRRDWLKGAMGGAAALVAGTTFGAPPAADSQTDASVRERALKGPIKHSAVAWCYKEQLDVEALAKTMASIGGRSVELVDPEYWPILEKHGLTCAIAGSHGFRTGFNNPDEWDNCIEILKSRIDACAAHGVKSVISFTGMANGIPPQEGAKNCIAGFKKIVPYAERNGVTICIEMLNTRDDSHPMKGHPGYQGNHTDYCIDIIEAVGSDHFKLLFDIYHVQIMDGDIIRRIRDIHEHIGHIHTAGNPGRGELDESQEIFYPAVMRALVEVGYDGFVGHEFIPTRDAVEGLRQAVEVCTV